MDALTRLAGDPRAFCDRVWGSRVHLHHGDPAPLAGLLDLDDADRLLTASALRTPAVRVVQDGTVVPASRFTRAATLAGSPLSGLVDGRRVLRLFEEGATVVLQGLHRYHPPLTELVRDLELRLGHPCQANAYLTPASSQGFGRHADSHDVFVFQTHGHKRWEVVEDGVGHEVVLEPGLSMYLPTGTPHSARAQEAVSLHVTVGINRLTWGDVLRRVVDDALADGYDDPLPAGWLERPGALAASLSERLTAAAGAVAGSDPARVVASETARFLTGRTPALQGGLRDLTELPRMHDGTVLVRRPTAGCVLVEAGDRVRVLLGDRELRVPARLREPLELVRDRDRLAVADLGPWLDPASRLVLARRLVREGLLRIER